ncbi:MAG TPA: Calx-beta domain-containing protein [Pyrinomonadaceae bacterium]|jgi:hypothetical protein
MFPLLRSRLARLAPLVLLLLLSANVCVAQDADELTVLALPAPTPLMLPNCARDIIYPYGICEITLNQSAYPNTPAGEKLAYTHPDITAVFHNTRYTNTTRDKTVHAFYDKQGGSLVFKLRFNASEVPPAGATDTWAYTLSCTPQPNGSCPDATQMNYGGGNVVVQNPPAGTPPENGFLRRDASQNYRLVYDSGYHPFVWGQTYYQIVNNALDVASNGSWATAVGNSAQNALNKIRLLLFPFPIDPAEQKYKPSQPFNDTAHDQVNIDHWTGLDTVVNKLYQTKDAKGSRLLAEIILFTDSTLLAFGADTTRDDRYVRYAVARYGAFPNVMWCLANEYQFARVPGTDIDDKDDKFGLKAAYFNDRAVTVRNNDPWKLDTRLQERALSIHPKNTPVFKFYDQTWPSHAVLQWSIGHDDCVNAGLKINSKCSHTDEWANFSIINNRYFSVSPHNPNKLPVFNDEYGYLGSRLKVDPDNPFATPAPSPSPTPICPFGPITNEMQRRGMWAIAVGGGYGSFGDSSGVCNGVKVGFTSTLTADWAARPAYNEIKLMSQFFTNVLPAEWWLMGGNNNLVAQTNTMRAYALELPGTTATANRGTYVIYAVPTGPTNPNSTSQGKFKVRNLRAGNYLTAFYNPRNGAQSAPASKIIKARTTYQFTATPYDDWVFRIYPDPLKSLTSSSDEYEITWVGDSLPAGASPAGYNEFWTWIDSDPMPITDSYAHQSAFVSGDVHQHYFTGATEKLTVNPGDKLFAYVYLDPLNPPSEVMLQWDDGSSTWAHRAYWGADNLPNWGTNGTNSRRNMGALPPTGQWVRLEVPAYLVGLEGLTINSMAFTLYGGQATWDDAGKTGQGVVARNLAVGKAATQSSTYTAAPPGGPASLAVDGNTNGNYFGNSVSSTNLDTQAWWQVDLGAKNWLDQVRVWNRTDCCPDRLSDFYVFVSDEPFGSTDANDTQEQPGVSTYFVAGQAGSPSFVDVGRSGRYVRVQLSGANYLSLAEVEVFGKPAATTTAPAPPPTITINDTSGTEGNAGSTNAVFTVSLSATSANTVLVNYATANGTAIANSDYTPVSGTLTFSPGQTSKTLSVPVIGDASVESNETFFVNLSSPTNATIADAQGQATIINDDSAPPPAGEVVWVEDGLPPGTTGTGEGETWNWVGFNPQPLSGTAAHQSSYGTVMHQHYFTGATGSSALTPAVGDQMFAYIYLDPMNPPSEIMLQWADNASWNHRAYWGSNQIGFGTDGTTTRRYAGPLPPTGRWVRLEVPASVVGVEGVTLQGMAFTLYGGLATWDYAGKVSNDTVWVDDSVPFGATPVAETESWNWVSGFNPSPFAGSAAHQSALLAGTHQHYFNGAADTLVVNAGNKLFTYVYLDPSNPPSEVMLQWDDGSGSWAHRAYWGADQIGFGVSGTPTRYYAGSLPPAGRWVRLEVPASAVNLQGVTLRGMAFALYGGRATWDRAGKAP